MSGKAGRSGRRPLPTALKVLRGNPGKRPLPKDEPRPQPKLPPPPAELSDEAKREWRRTGRRLRAAGLITELDTAAFAAYCSSYARWLQAQALLSNAPMLELGSDGTLRPSPLLRIVQQAQEQFTRALTEFGMSPSSRTRVQVSRPSKDGDPFEAYDGA